MRTLSCAACLCTLALSCLAGEAAWADNNYFQNYSQFGMSLPTPTMPSGQDEVRAADGTSCRSAVGGDGTFLDLGVIGSPENTDMQGSAAAYGRVVVPLGYRPPRVDCTRIYELEIQRLQMELQLARMGLSGSLNTAAANVTDPWAAEGWGNGAPQPAAGKPAVRAARKTAAAGVKLKAMAEPVEDVSSSLY